MPRVRRIQPGQITPNALPNPRRSQLPIGQVPTPQINFRPQANAAQLGDTIQNVAGVLGRQDREIKERQAALAEQERQKANAARVRSAETELLGSFQGYLTDPKTGVLNTVKGEQALALQDKASEYRQKRYSEILGALNPEQQEAFQQLAARHLQAFDLDVSRHVTRETEAFQQRDFKANIDLKAAEVIRNAGDPARMANGLVSINSEIERFGKEQGLGQKWVDAEKAKASSDLWAASIKKLIADGKAPLAKAYFESQKDNILGDQRNVLAKALEEGIKDDRAFKAADAIRKQLPFGTPGVTQAVWMEAAAQIEDPDVRKEAESRLRTQWQVHQEDASALKQQQTGLAKETVDAWLRNAANRLDAGLAKDALKSLPGWADMDEDTRKKAISYADAIQKGTEKIVTDPDVYYPLFRLGSNPETQQEFAKMNLLAVRKDLDDGDWNRLVELQGAILKKDPEKVKELIDDFRTETQVVNSTLEAAGIEVNPKAGTPEATRLNQLQRQLSQRVLAIQGRTQKKATNAEIQQELDKLLIEAIPAQSPWFWFNTPGKRAFEVSVTDIPAADLAQINALLRSRKFPETDENRVRLYLEKLNAEKGK